MQPTFSELQLNSKPPDQFSQLSSPNTASLWFLVKFPGLAQQYGAPFLENKTSTIDGFSLTSPISPNISFMAAVLGLDDEIQNSVVYYGPECQFYYFEPWDQKYHTLPDQKLGDLMRGYFARCASDVQKDVNVYHLFTTFCHDQVVKAIVERAKSILRCSDNYFSATSPFSRENGVELHERLARIWIEKGMVVKLGGMLLCLVAFDRYSEMAKERDLPPLKRSQFTELMKPLMREKYGSLRNDLVVDGRYQRGWKDVRLVGK